MVSVCLSSDTFSQHLQSYLNFSYPRDVGYLLELGYHFTAAPEKCSHCSLPWTKSISSQPPPPDIEPVVDPPGPMQPLLLGLSSFSVSVILLLFPSRVLLISVIALIVTTCLFISSRSMVYMFISPHFRPLVYLLATLLSFQDFVHLYSHYSELFFRVTFCLHFFCLFWWIFII